MTHVHAELVPSDLPIFVQPSTKEHLHMVLGTLQRDLKPRNVVFSDDGRAKLTDFGMGRIGLSMSLLPLLS